MPPNVRAALDHVLALADQSFDAVLSFDRLEHVPDPTRALFKGKPLHYGEGSLSAALVRAGAVPLLLPALAGLGRLARRKAHA